MNQKKFQFYLNLGNDQIVELKISASVLDLNNPQLKDEELSKQVTEEINKIEEPVKKRKLAVFNILDFLMARDGKTFSFTEFKEYVDKKGIEEETSNQIFSDLKERRHISEIATDVYLYMRR